MTQLMLRAYAFVYVVLFTKKNVIYLNILRHDSVTVQDIFKKNFSFRQWSYLSLD